ncbi:biotin transporter BioY [Methanobrevibacter cuticularis]|uniref:Biotin transporter BioY n=1 Tax=Methanobrevibacter cuticularis TaxID=47311 RepID=A0A166DS61_9EURY|nr:biotin transporter BioY [Methanobrevibacter cuticularis]KZX15896.1 biotin transporter BioY [Methanobrevibacter cuticularis]
MDINIDSYYEKREHIFEKIHNSTNLEKAAMVLLMACFTGLAAQIIIPLPWTPVPITAQTFAVLISGLFLGKKLGPLSQIVYILGGVLGIAWYGGMTGGIDILLGSTGGYFLGFIFASFFIGYFSEKYSKSRKFRNMLPIMLIANFVCIYVPGLIVLAIWYNLNIGGYPDILSLLIMGLIPFLVGDLIKIAGASIVSKVFLPK